VTSGIFRCSRIKTPVVVISKNVFRVALRRRQALTVQGPTDLFRCPENRRPLLGRERGNSAGRRTPPAPPRSSRSMPEPFRRILDCPYRCTLSCVTVPLLLKIETSSFETNRRSAVLSILVSVALADRARRFRTGVVRIGLEAKADRPFLPSRWPLFGESCFPVGDEAVHRRAKGHRYCRCCSTSHGAAPAACPACWVQRDAIARGVLNRSRRSRCDWWRPVADHVQGRRLLPVLLSTNSRWSEPLAWPFPALMLLETSIRRRPHGRVSPHSAPVPVVDVIVLRAHPPPFTRHPVPPPVAVETRRPLVVVMARAPFGEAETSSRCCGRDTAVVGVRRQRPWVVLLNEISCRRRYWRRADAATASPLVADDGASDLFD